MQSIKHRRNLDCIDSSGKMVLLKVFYLKINKRYPIEHVKQLVLNVLTYQI